MAICIGQIAIYIRVVDDESIIENKIWKMTMKIL